MNLEIYGYVLDERGSVEDAILLRPSLDLEEKGTTIRENGLQVHTAFRASPGVRDIRLLIRDISTGRTGAERLQVEVPSLDAPPEILHPPLFMDNLDNRIILRVSSLYSPSSSLFFEAVPGRLTPQIRPELANGSPTDVYVVL